MPADLGSKHFKERLKEELGLQNYRLNANVHCFAIDGYRVIYDINSGSIHLGDEAVWKVITCLAKTGIESIADGDPGAADTKDVTEDVTEDVVQELRRLKEEGLLFTEPAAPAELISVPVLKALCLHAAHDCNLRCRYCFAATGHFGGERKLMPFSVGKAALDMLFQESGSRRYLEVDFFGGEPLLNWDVVRELILYGENLTAAANKVFRFTLTTNAILLDDDIIAFLNDHGVSVVLSLDGCPSTNDQMRVFPGGGSTYSRVVDNIDRLVASREGLGYYVRGTYTRMNLDFCRDVKHLADLGWKEISVEPVVADETAPYSIRTEDLPRIDQEYDELSRFYLERQHSGNPFSFFHFNLDILRGPCLPKRLSGCGAGCEYMAVSPEGDLYPCHQLVGNQDYLLGNVNQGLTNSGVAQRFHAASIFTKRDCPSCWARLLCSGGCHANAVSLEGDLRQPYRIGCHITRKRLECALYLKVRELLDLGEADYLA